MLTLPLRFDQASLRARLSGRSWWVLRYASGRILPEWECDWTLAPAKGRRGLRLYTPNGQIAELEATSDGPGGTGRFLQFKVAVRSIRSGRHLRAHVIGRIDGLDGQCDTFAWEPGHLGDDGRQVPGRLIHFADNAYCMRYENVGALCTDHLGLVAP